MFFKRVKYNYTFYIQFFFLLLICVIYKKKSRICNNYCNPPMSQFYYREKDQHYSLANNFGFRKLFNDVKLVKLLIFNNHT